ncbi:MAG: hypothetical protein LBE99_04710 [Puniceicoccales bacterium]|jgi:hypothetical protein|nr:hypothetical protein [Puniceicoccales bacterium]
MLNWILLTEDALEDYLAKDQLALLTQHQVSNNPLNHLIVDICAYVRSFVPNALLPSSLSAASIPDVCKSIACTLIIEVLQARLPEIQLSNDQIRNADNARQSLLNLQEIWQNECNDAKRPSRIEAVRHRPHDANTKTLQGF